MDTLDKCSTKYVRKYHFSCQVMDEKIQLWNAQKIKIIKILCNKKRLRCETGQKEWQNIFYIIIN